MEYPGKRGTFLTPTSESLRQIADVKIPEEIQPQSLEDSLDSLLILVRLYEGGFVEFKKGYKSRFTDSIWRKHSNELLSNELLNPSQFYEPFEELTSSVAKTLRKYKIHTTKRNIRRTISEFWEKALSTAKCFGPEIIPQTPPAFHFVHPYGETAKVEDTLMDTLTSLEAFVDLLETGKMELNSKKLSEPPFKASDEAADWGRLSSYLSKSIGHNLALNSKLPDSSIWALFFNNAIGVTKASSHMQKSSIGPSFPWSGMYATESVQSADVLSSASFKPNMIRNMIVNPRKMLAEVTDQGIQLTVTPIQSSELETTATNPSSSRAQIEDLIAQNKRLWDTKIRPNKKALQALKGELPSGDIDWL